MQNVMYRDSGACAGRQRSCRLQAQYLDLTDLNPLQIPLPPKRAGRGRSAVCIKYGTRIIAGPVFVSGHGGAQFATTGNEFILHGTNKNHSKRVRKQKQLLLPITNNIQLFVGIIGNFEPFCWIEYS